jgi:hypothetical protein
MLVLSAVGFQTGSGWGLKIILGLAPILVAGLVVGVEDRRASPGAGVDFAEFGRSCLVANNK